MRRDNPRAVSVPLVLTKTKPARLDALVACQENFRTNWVKLIVHVAWLVLSLPTPVPLVALIVLLVPTLMPLVKLVALIVLLDVISPTLAPLVAWHVLKVNSLGQSSLSNVSLALSRPTTLR